MHTRFLPIFFGVVFALTLFFVAVAGAQEERTDTEDVGTQAVDVQQQQVPNDQQHAVAVQQQAQNDQQQAVDVQQQQVEVQADGLAFAEGRQSDSVQVAAADNSGALRGTEVEARTTDDDRLVDLVRIPLPEGCRLTNDTFSFVLQDGDGTQADFIEGPDDGEHNIRVNRDGDILRVTSNADDPDGNGPDEPDISPFNVRGGDEELDTRNDEIVTSTGVRCQGDDNDGNNNNNNGNNNNNNGGNNRGSNAVVNNQYGVDRLDAEDILLRGDDQILADTIPLRELPFTGGVPLLGLAAIGLAAIVAGSSVLRAVTRRGR